MGKGGPHGNRDSQFLILFGATLRPSATSPGLRIHYSPYLIFLSLHSLTLSHPHTNQPNGPHTLLPPPILLRPPPRPLPLLPLPLLLRGGTQRGRTFLGHGFLRIGTPTPCLAKTPPPQLRSPHGFRNSRLANGTRFPRRSAPRQVPRSDLLADDDSVASEAAGATRRRLPRAVRAFQKVPAIGARQGPDSPIGRCRQAEKRRRLRARGRRRRRRGDAAAARNRCQRLRRFAQNHFFGVGRRRENAQREGSPSG
ncbi:hypothetical protein JHK86_053980 [Glycine max]|nr:hypothetical protein JHK86_053980 [Glycine max]